MLRLSSRRTALATSFLVGAVAFGAVLACSTFRAAEGDGTTGATDAGANGETGTTPTVDGGSDGSSFCTGTTAKLCDDFERDDVGAGPWTDRSENGGARLSIDHGMAASGSSSLRATIAPPTADANQTTSSLIYQIPDQPKQLVISLALHLDELPGIPDPPDDESYEVHFVSVGFEGSRSGILLLGSKYYEGLHVAEQRGSAFNTFVEYDEPPTSGFRRYTLAIDLAQRSIATSLDDRAADANRLTIDHYGAVRIAVGNAYSGPKDAASNVWIDDVTIDYR